MPRSGFEAELVIVEQALKLFGFSIAALENDASLLESNVAQIASNAIPPSPPPPPPPGVGSITVNVEGCGVLGYAGATVTASQGGSVVATQTTNSSGQAFFSGLSTVSTVFAVSPGYAGFATPSNQTTTIVSGSNPSLSFALANAAGYYCAAGCAAPLPTTIHLSDTNVTGLALTYSATVGGWIGCYLKAGQIGDFYFGGVCSPGSTLTTSVNYIFQGTGLTAWYPTCNGSGSTGLYPTQVTSCVAGPVPPFSVSAASTSNTLVCSPFSFSGTMQLGPGFHLVNGIVTVTL